MVFNQPISTNHFFMSQFPSFGSWSSWKDKASLESPASWTASNDWRVVPMFRTAFSYPFSIGKSHAKWLTSSEIVMSALKNYHFLFGNLMPSGLNHLQSPYFASFFHSILTDSHLIFPSPMVFSQPFPKLPLGSPHRSPFQRRQHRAAHALEAEPDLQQFPQREERRPGRAGHWDSLEHAWRTSEKPKKP